MSNHVFPPSSGISGVFVPPGDKSISHRAVMFGALGSGKSYYKNFLQGEDCLHSMKAFEAMGVQMELKSATGELTIEGVGLRGLNPPAKDLYLGNSGTSMRLMLGILAGQKFEVTLTGDPSLSSRPMKRVTHPLKQMGAQIKGRENGNFAPLTIRGGKLKGIEFHNPLSSAQVKSAIVFAGLFAEGRTKISEPVLSRDHTEKFLQAAGVPFVQEDNGKTLIIEKIDSLQPIVGDIPGDPSSAAFFLTGAALVPGAQVRVERMCLNPTRVGFLKVLERMGAQVHIEWLGKTPDLTGNVSVLGGALQGTRITRDEIPSLIDEIPILMIAMALAEGESLISGAEELRVKETDRIYSMVTNLRAIGGQADELPDGCLIKGVKNFSGGAVKSFGDHRTAMSFAIASLRSESSIEVEDVDCISTSFPTFFESFQNLRKP